jgi:hypothetical protein
MKYQQIIRETAKKLNITLVDVVKEPEYIDNIHANEDYFRERSECIVADREIILGFYRYKIVRLASFFHEVGHILATKNDYEGCKTCEDYERVAWKLGEQYALMEYNIDFNDYNNVQIYKNNCLSSYKKLKDNICHED